MGAITQLQSTLGRGGFTAVLGAVIVVAMLGIGGLRRQGALRTAAVLAVAGLLVSGLGVLSLTLTGPLPSSIAEPVLILDPVAGAWGWDSIAWRPVYDNVALFVPVGAFAAAVLRRRSIGVVWLACVALSVGVEAYQYLVPTGRVANTADVLANATGALIGVLLAVALGARATAARVGSPRPRVDA